MEKWITANNIDHFEKLLSMPLDPGKRRVFRTLLINEKKIKSKLENRWSAKVVSEA